MTWIFNFSTIFFLICIACRYRTCCVGHTSRLLRTEFSSKFWTTTDYQCGKICIAKCGNVGIEIPILAIFSDATLVQIREQYELLCWNLHEIYSRGDHQNEITIGRWAGGIGWTIVAGESDSKWEERENCDHHGIGFDFGWHRYGKTELHTNTSAERPN